jgi:hypothetical protein
MLAYELFLKNQENKNGYGHPLPIKKIFVKVDSTIALQLDPKSLEHYGDEPSQNDSFRKTLSMPLNNLESVGLPNEATGSASKKPYLEFYGSYGKGKLEISVQGKKGEKQKTFYEYLFDFENSKEVSTTKTDSLVLRLDRKNYFVQDKPLFETYREAGIVNADSELSSEVFLRVCKAFASFWQEKKMYEELKNFWGNIRFRIVVLPYSLMSDELKIEYRNDESTDVVLTQEFEDSFGNPATDYPSKRTKNAKFVSFDDQAFTINCRTGRDFYQNLGIGNQSFPKINVPSEGGFRISGLDWYFFDLTDRKFHFEKTGSGIYDQLLSNYKLLSSRPGVSASRASAMKIICAKKAQAKLEVLLDENLTFDQMKEMLSRAQDNFSWHPRALESLIIEKVKNSKKVVLWTDYLTAIRCFMNGTSFDRSVLLQRYLSIIRETYLRNWIKGTEKEKEKTQKEKFFETSQFCLNMLTQDGKKGLDMNKNEDYAYKIGVIAGKYVKFKRDTDPANNSTNDILTYSKYDRDRLRFVYRRIGIGISLSKVDKSIIEQSVKEAIPMEEIEDAKANEDYSYFFYKGVFKNL